MPAWQHAWISVDPMKPEDISKLETYGKEGWELVSVLPWGQTWQYQRPPQIASEIAQGTIASTGGIFLMFFKRQVPDESFT